MKRFLLATTFLTFAPAMAFAQGAQDRWNFQGPTVGSQEVTISGTGSNNSDFDAGNFGITGTYGHYFTEAFQVSLRQSVNWAGSRDDDDRWNGSTRVAADFHFNTNGRLRPFIGANIGYLYGDDVRNTGIIGPEVGLKYFVNPTTFILAQTEYQIFFRRSRDVTDNFDDGAFAHTIGVGFIF